MPSQQFLCSCCESFTASRASAIGPEWSKARKVALEGHRGGWQLAKSVEALSVGVAGSDVKYAISSKREP